MVVFLLVMAGLAWQAAQKTESGMSVPGTPTIGVIEVNGAISGGTSQFLGSVATSSGEIMQTIREARQRKDIKAVVLSWIARGTSELLRKSPWSLTV